LIDGSSSCRSWSPPVSAFAGFRFPPEVIVVAIRWCLRFNLSYRESRSCWSNVALGSTT
jgi:transposase-like protein